MPEPKLYIIDFINVEEAIVFAKEQWPDQDLEAVEVMRAIQVEELGENDGWSCIVGVCDICGVEGVNFLPSLIYAEGVVGIECFNCGNMSFYPMEQKEGCDD